MSTNKTENYQLNIWTAEDEERLEEINENFGKIDEAMDICQAVMGSYIGTNINLTQEIELGFRPRAVLIMPNLSNFGGDRRGMGGLVIEGQDNDWIHLTDAGFRVKGSMNAPNSSSDGTFVRNPWRYLVWK